MHMLLRTKIYLRTLGLYYCTQDITLKNVLEMDWINCNKCCRQPGDEKERTFMLTSCGHIFCDLCLSKAESREKCQSCSTPCQLMQLSSKMKPDAEMFFLEPAELLKRQYSQVNRLLEFQKEHRIRLVSFHRRVLQKYKELEKQHSATTKRMQEIEKRYSVAAARVQELEMEVHKLRGLSSGHGGASGSNAIGQHSATSPTYARSGTSQRTSPQQVLSPQGTPGGTRISPGRLTLVKTNQGNVVSGHSPTNLHSVTPTHSMSYSRKSPQNSQFASQLQSHQYMGHHQNQHQFTHRDDASVSSTGSGGSYYRCPNLTPPRTPTPNRSALGMNQVPMLKAGQHILQSSHEPQRVFYGSPPPRNQHQPARSFSSQMGSAVVSPPQGYHPSYGKYIS